MKRIPGLTRGFRSTSVKMSIAVALSFNVMGAALNAHEMSEPRWLAPSEDIEMLPEGGSILFWQGDTQIAGFRNTHRLSSTRYIESGEQARYLPKDTHDFGQLSYQIDNVSYDLDDFMQHNHVAGLLVLKDGEVRLERYGLGNQPHHRWVSFSMTKSVVSLLTGAAIADGYIGSVEDPVTDYLPQMKGSSYDGVRIRDVLQMASGTDWNEDYADPESDVASSPGDMLELMHFLGSKQRIAEPGTRFNYNTGETNLAGAIVRAAIGNNLSAYLSEKIWKPWGMGADAYWMSHGPNGGELGGCCIAATLRDWGRLATFVLNDGQLDDGTNVLPPGWMQESTAPSPASDQYGYLWWLEDNGAFRASGIFGQGVYFNPDEKLAIVVFSAWPEATSRQHLELHRNAMFRAVETELVSQ